MLLRRKEMERSSSADTRGQKMRRDKRCLSPEGLCLCFICWQSMQLSAFCQQRRGNNRSRLCLGAPTGSAAGRDARCWDEAHQVCSADRCLPPVLCWVTFRKGPRTANTFCIAACPCCAFA